MSENSQDSSEMFARSLSTMGGGYASKKCTKFRHLLDEERMEDQDHRSKNLLLQFMPIDLRLIHVAELAEVLLSRKW